MKIRFRFKQKMLTLCCVPMILLTVFSMILGLAQFKDGMYKETKSSLYSSAIAALNLYQSQGYGDYALKSDGDVWRGKNFDVSTETSVVDGLKEKTGVDITFFFKDTAVMTSIKRISDGSVCRQERTSKPIPCSRARNCGTRTLRSIIKCVMPILFQSHSPVTEV